MSNRNVLAIRARAVGLDPTTIPNDSKLEQKVLWLEKNMTAFTGTLGSGTLTSNNTNVSDGDIVTIGGQTYTFKTNLSQAYATGTLTSDATAPADGDTVTIEGQTYTFRTALTIPSRPFEVLIGASAAIALDNLKSAINNDGTSGVYSSNTPAHPLVTATTNTNTTQVVQSNRHGVRGNSYLTVAVSAHLSWGASSLTGGADHVTGQIKIGGSADASLTNLVSAINGAGTPDTDFDAQTPVNQNVTAGAVTSHATTVTAKNYANTNGSIATTKTATTLSWGAGTLASGVSKVIVDDGTTASGAAGVSGDKNVT